MTWKGQAFKWRALGWLHTIHVSSSTFLCGEQLIAIDRKGRKRLFEFKEELSSNEPKVVRRPTLNEYVLLMKRTATPTYPKDIAAMMNMMDIEVGSKVIEAGSGSGALTLYLSRAGIVHKYK